MEPIHSFSDHPSLNSVCDRSAFRSSVQITTYYTTQLTMKNTTIYTIQTNPNSDYGHGESTQEQIDTYDTNLHIVLIGTTHFNYVDSRNQNTDQPTDVYSTSDDIIISHGCVIEIEPQDEDSNVCDLSTDFIELVTMRGGYDPYVKFTQETINFLNKAIDGWFDRIKRS